MRYRGIVCTDKTYPNVKIFEADEKEKLKAYMREFVINSECEHEIHTEIDTSEYHDGDLAKTIQSISTQSINYIKRNL
jgi:hypothetical protein